MIAFETGLPHRQMTLLAGAAALMLCGCQPAASPARTEVPATGIAAPAPVFTVNEMMVMIVDQPGELLWDVEKAGHAPNTGEDWYQLQTHAAALAGAATLLQLGGTGPADAGWAAQPAWRDTARQLTVAALTAKAAAKAQNLPALIRANGAIVEACEACHKAFKPDIPTGGLFLHKRPGVTS